MLSIVWFVSAFFLLHQYANAQIKQYAKCECALNLPSADCKCVPYYLCNGTETKPTIRITDRFGLEECPGSVEICCAKENIQFKPNIPSTLNQSNQKLCGIRNRDGLTLRIAGDVDNKAQFSEFPWMVAVMYKSHQTDNFTYICGGSLIHPQVVLTAGHCVGSEGNYKVRVGEWDCQTTQELYPHQEKSVQKVILHPNYDPDNTPHVNDVSLLYLESEVLLAPHVNLVCLPPQSYVASGSECYVTGWGKDKFEKDGVLQNILKQIQVPVVNRSSCAKAFSRVLEKPFYLDSSFMCAGGEKGKDVCTGDGGGPLVCLISEKDPDRYQQVGIVSWGVACGLEGVPGGYVDVATFRDWIDFSLRQWNLNSTGYNY